MAKIQTTVALMAALAGCFVPALAQMPDVTVTPHSVSEDCGKTDPCAFDRLTLAGAWELTSAHPDFGGFSGLTLLDGKMALLSVSDRGYLLKAALTWNGTSVAAIAPSYFDKLITKEGGKWGKDAEAIEKAPDGGYYIAYERHHRLEKLDQQLKLAEVMGFPAVLQEQINENQGVEALVAFENGSILILTEESANDDGTLKAWLKRGEDYLPLRYPRFGDYSPVDAAQSDDGRIFVLERAFNLFTGLRRRVVELSRDDWDANQLLEVEEIAQIGLGYDIDNAEGLAFLRIGGAPYLMTLSDNNFRSFQKTILALFRLND